MHAQPLCAVAPTESETQRAQGAWCDMQASAAYQHRAETVVTRYSKAAFSKGEEDGTKYYSTQNIDEEEEEEDEDRRAVDDTVHAIQAGLARIHCGRKCSASRSSWAGV